MGFFLKNFKWKNFKKEKAFRQKTRPKARKKDRKKTASEKACGLCLFWKRKEARCGREQADETAKGAGCSGGKLP